MSQIRFLKLALRTFFSQSFAALALFLVGVLTARYLGPSDRGLYALFFTSASVLSMLSYLGMTQANVYFLNKPETSHNSLISNNIAFVVFQALLLGVVLYALGDRNILFAGTRLSEDFVLLLFIASALTLADMLFSGIALGLHRYTVFVQNLVTQSALIFLVTIPLVVLELTLHQVVLLRIFGSVAAAVILVARVLLASQYRTVSPRWSLLVQQLSFGIRNYVQNLLGLLSYRIYFFLLAFFTDEVTVGVFSVAMLLLEAIRLIPEAVGTILFPELAKSDQSNVADQFTSKVTRIVLAISLLVTLGVFALAAPVVLLIFGDDYRGAIILLRVMTFGVAVGILYQVLSRYFTSRFQQHKTILSAIAGLFAGVLLSLFLIPRMGAIGAAVSFSAANLIAGVIMAVLFQRTTGLSFQSFIILNSDDIDAARSSIRAWLNRPKST